MYLPKTLFDYGSDKSGAWLEFWGRRCDTEGRGGISKTLFLSRMEGFEFSKARCDRMWNRGSGSQRFRYDAKNATIYWLSRHKQGTGRRCVNLTPKVLAGVQKIGDFTALASVVVATNVVAKANGCIARGRTLRTIGRTTDTAYKSTVSARIERGRKKGWINVKPQYIQEFGENWRIRNSYSTTISNVQDKFSPSFNRTSRPGALKFVLPTLENVRYVKNGRREGIHHPFTYTGMMDKHCKDLFSPSF